MNEGYEYRCFEESRVKMLNKDKNIQYFVMCCRCKKLIRFKGVNWKNRDRYCCECAIIISKKEKGRVKDGSVN